jgi:hypothetical protein
VQVIRNLIRQAADAAWSIASCRTRAGIAEACSGITIGTAWLICGQSDSDNVHELILIQLYFRASKRELFINGSYHYSTVALFLYQPPSQQASNFFK